MVSPESAEPISPPKILPLLALSGSVTPSLLLLQPVNIRPPILSTIFDSGDDTDDDDMDDEDLCSIDDFLYCVASAPSGASIISKIDTKTFKQKNNQR